MSYIFYGQNISSNGRSHFYSIRPKNVLILLLFPVIKIYEPPLAATAPFLKMFTSASSGVWPASLWRSLIHYSSFFQSLLYSGLAVLSRPPFFKFIHPPATTSRSITFSTWSSLILLILQCSRDARWEKWDTFCLAGLLRKRPIDVHIFQVFYRFEKH